MGYVQQGFAVLIVFVSGAFAGSFVNLLAYRMPREIPILAHRPFCPKCRCAIPWAANIPILAWLRLRGRCASCSAPIPVRYPLAEIALASIAAYLYLAFPAPDAVARFVLCAALFTVALIDYDWRVIPNAITFAGIPLGLLAASIMMPEIGWRSSLGGIAIGASFLYLTGGAYRLIRGAEGIGMGDVWLVGMIGAFLGWRGAIFTLFSAAILASLGSIVLGLLGGPPTAPTEPVPDAVARVTGGNIDQMPQAPSSWMRTTIPLGPFLALAATVFALFEPQLTSWYLSR